VPRRGFALTMLTNSDAGPALLNEFFVDDWALRHFAGVSNLPATPRPLSNRRLARYEGGYTGQQVGFDGALQEFAFELAAEDGQLVSRIQGQVVLRLAFYRHDHVLVLDESGRQIVRADFVRGAGGRVAWLRLGGRLYRHGVVGTARAARQIPTWPSPYLG
jgi:hypothetical protein